MYCTSIRAGYGRNAFAFLDKSRIAQQGVVRNISLTFEAHPYAAAIPWPHFLESESPRRRRLLLAGVESPHGVKPTVVHAPLHSDFGGRRVFTLLMAAHVAEEV